MPVQFNNPIKFRNVPEERIDETDLVGGLITDVHETKLQPNQSPDMANIVFTATKSIKTRNGYTRFNGNPIGISADQSETGASSGSLAMDAYGDYVAQTFIPSGSIDVCQIDLYLEVNTTGEQQRVVVEIWSTSGGIPSAIVANGNSQIKTVTDDSETAYNFRFRKPVSLTAATTYAIVVRPFINSASSAVNQVNVYHRADTYASGNVYTSTDSGSNWTTDSAKDLKFVVYSGGDTGSTGLVRYYKTDGTKQMFAKFGSTLYRANDLTGALTAITFPSGLSLEAANHIDYTVTNDTLLLIDKSGYIKKYRGSTNADYTTGTITVANGSTSVVGSGTSWNTSTNAEAGEYIKLPDGKWYKIASISSDTSIAIETEYLGGGASGQSYTISPWGEVQGKLSTATGASSLVRPQPDFIETHIDRVWTLEGNTLRFSVLDTSIDEENFNDWDTSNNAGSIIIPAGKGDTCTGLYSLNNTLYVFQRRAIWRLYGTSPSNFELRNVSNEIGMIDKSTLVEYENILTFLSDSGIYIFDGSNFKNVSENKVNSSINSWANKTSPKATLWENNYMISYSTSGELANDEVLVYDYKNDVFSKFTGLYVSSWVRWGGGSDSGEIYFGSSNQGSIYKWNDGLNDDGYEVETIYYIPSIGFSSGMNDKTIKKFYIQQIAVGNWDMNITQYGNLSESIITGSDINLSPGDTSVWDVAQWDVDEWSSEGAIITSRVAEFQGLSKYFKFKIYQKGLNEGIEVLLITITARLRRLQ